MERYSIETVFRKWSDGTIDALFPYETELNYCVSGYTHIGQHFIADYSAVISKTKPAKEEEYLSLLKELTRIGYDVKIIKKANGNKMRESWSKLWKL